MSYIHTPAARSERKEEARRILTPLTPDELMRAMNRGDIHGIKKPLTEAQKNTFEHKKQNYQGGPAGAHLESNRAACEEVLALGDKLSYGDRYRIVMRHNAHPQTVYKMVWNRKKCSLVERRRHVVTAEQVRARV